MIVNKLAKIALVLASLVFCISIISNSFEGDFGWHLRFGKDAFAGNFQYLDSYTWPHFGQPWTNHEWGGDLLFWFLYSNFGYFSLVILTSLALTGALIIIQKAYSKKIDLVASLVIFVCAFTLQFMLTMRLAIIASLFFALMIYTLEKIPHRRFYMLWPLIIWLWSALHGSWLLAFIVINIYLAGNLGGMILKKYKPQFSGANTGWNYQTIRNVIIFQIVSISAVAINPYGFKIFSEILAYFSESYFKQYITEWLPSYSFPVFAGPLILAALSAIFIVWGYREKKVSLPQALLFFAIFYSVIKYKRNNLYLVLVCAPIVAEVMRLAIEQIKINIKISRTIIGLLLVFSAFVLPYFIPKINFGQSIWDDQQLLSNPPYIFPYQAVKFLQNKIGNEKTYIFNEFWWGGYLNWTLPNALVYLDGRGTATWHVSEKETTLEHYHKIKFEAGGLKEINESPARLVLLEKSYPIRAKTGNVNSLLFTQKELAKISSPATPQLEKMLDKSKNWKLIYEDKIAKIWERLE